MNRGSLDSFLTSSLTSFVVLMRTLGAQKKKPHLLTNSQRTLLSHVLSLPPSLEHSTCFKLSARNTMYTQQKPSWVTIRKKLTIFLEERRKKTCYKRRIGLSFLVLSPGVGDLVPAPSLLLTQSTMGCKKGGNNHSFKKKSVSQPPSHSQLSKRGNSS